MLLLPPATTGVPVLAISFLAAGESICSRSVLLGVPSLARKAGLKVEKQTQNDNINKIKNHIVGNSAQSLILAANRLSSF